MSNTHLFCLFERAELDHVLAMTWRQFQKKMKWNSRDTRNFIVENALSEEYASKVDAVFSEKTVRQTFRFCGSHFYFLMSLLENTNNCCTVTIPKGNYEFGEEIFSCAALGYQRGELSFPSLVAAFNLHLGWVTLDEYLAPAIAAAILELPMKAMLPRLPDAQPGKDCGGGNGLNVADTRRFMTFLTRAWDGDWPEIRSSEVAGLLFHTIRDAAWAKPCICHWFEC